MPGKLWKIFHLIHQQLHPTARRIRVLRTLLSAIQLNRPQASQKPSPSQEILIILHMLQGVLVGDHFHTRVPPRLLVSWRGESQYSEFQKFFPEIDPCFDLHRGEPSRPPHVRQASVMAGGSSAPPNHRASTSAMSFRVKMLSIAVLKIHHALPSTQTKWS